MEERLSAAGAAAAAADRPAVPIMATTDGRGHGSGSAGRGILPNPPGYPSTSDACNVHWGEHARLEKLKGEWYGEYVGDGADEVTRDELDPWQKFAYDVVCSSHTKALRMCMSSISCKRNKPFV